jgi:hypothetical protein
MRAITVTAISALALATAIYTLPATAAAKKKRTCNPRHSSTVAANTKLRIFRRTVKSGDTLFFGCAYKTRRPFRLPSNEPGVDGYGPFALSGRFVAFGYYPSCGTCVDEDNFVWVFNAFKRKGRQLLLDDNDDGKVTRITDIEVNRTGSVGWISRDLKSPASVLVQKAEGSATTPTLLDSGPDIERQSLASSGTTLYWTKAGAPRSAPFGG